MIPFVLGSENVTLYPKVEEGHYIIFNRDSSATYYEPQFVAPGEVTQDPGTPTRKGYSFQGWTTTEGSTTPDFTFGNELEESITLYAVWKPEKTSYVVRIRRQSNSNSKNTPEDEKTYTNYGMYETVTDVDTESVVNSADIATDLTYPGYVRNTSRDAEYTIAGDGTTIVDIYFDRELVTYVYFTRATDNEGEQYGESRWYDSASQLFALSLGEDGQWYHNGTVYNGTRYVKNTEITGLYGTSFEVNDVSAPALKETTTGQYGWYNRNTHYSLTSFIHAELFENGNTLYLKELLNTSALRDITYHYEQWDGSETTKEEAGPYSFVSGHHTQNATRWLVAYQYEGQNRVELGWTPEVTVDAPLSSSVRTHVYYELLSYNLTFYNYNQVLDNKTTSIKATTPILTTVKDVTPPRPDGIPDSFTFQGWYTNQNFTTEVSESTTMPARDVTVYAKWSEPSFTIKVHKDLNPNGEYEEITVIYLDLIDQTTLRDIVESDKWATRANDGTFTIFNLATQIEKDYELYPVTVDPEYSYTLTYDMDGGTGSVVDGNSYMAYTFAEVQSANGSKKDGTPFLKWEKDGISYYPGSYIQITEDTTLKAIYGLNPNPTSITYKPNGGQGKDYTISNIVNNDTIAVAYLEQTGITRAGYTFKGWSLDPNDSDNLLQPGEGILVNNDGENVLYAIWEKNPETPTKETTKTDTNNTGVETSMAQYALLAMLAFAGIAVSKKRYQ